MILYNDVLCQFKKYYEPNEDIPAPIKLESCVSHSGGQITLAEPLVRIILLFFRLYRRGLAHSSNFQNIFCDEV